MSKFRVLLPISLAISLLSGNVFAKCSNFDYTTELKVVGISAALSSTNPVGITYVTVDNNTKDFCWINTKEHPRGYELLKTAYLTGQPFRARVNDKTEIGQVVLGQSSD